MEPGQEPRQWPGMTPEAFYDEVERELSFAPEELRGQYLRHVVGVMAAEAAAHDDPDEETIGHLRHAKQQRRDFEAEHDIWKDPPNKAQ